jgi:RNA polymerase sigma-70 factor (ECF subfamily)
VESRKIVPPAEAAPRVVPLELQSTAELLSRARNGEAGALDVLFGRCVPALRRWARGRLPAAARGLLETEDLVQETVVSVLKRLPEFESRHQGALQAYLRQTALNRIRDVARSVSRRPAEVGLGDRHEAPGASPLEVAIGREALDKYEAALQRLSPKDREAVIARLEFQMTYDEIATAVGKPTANAARIAVVRALYRLTKSMRHGA